MLHILPFLTGYIASLIGTLLPGILNATAVKISKEEGIKNAHSFMLGTFVIIALQTYLAVFFARIIDSSEFISNILREIGFVIFTLLTFYFFLTKPTTNINTSKLIKRKKARFTHGIILALLNVFPIFYYVFVSITASKNNWYEIHFLNNVLLTIGVILGTFTAFKSYIKLFKNSSLQDNFILKNINKIIGTITGFIAILNLYKILS